MSEPSQQPSQQARRAAEAIEHQFAQSIFGNRQFPNAEELTQIIERETGVGEATRLLWRVLEVIELLPFYRFHPSDNIQEWMEQARAFLASTPESHEEQKTCPHAHPFTYCPECVVSPCPIGIGGKVQPK